MIYKKISKIKNVLDVHGNLSNDPQAGDTAASASEATSTVALRMCTIDITAVLTGSSDAVSIKERWSPASLWRGYLWRSSSSSSPCAVVLLIVHDDHHPDSNMPCLTDKRRAVNPLVLALFIAFADPADFGRHPSTLSKSCCQFFPHSR